MRKNIIIGFSIIIILLCIIAVGIFIIKPAFIYDVKYEMINMYHTVKVCNSNEYKALKNVDKSKKYFKNEKDIKIPILLYHEISKEKSNKNLYDMYVTTSKFEEQVKDLLEMGYTFISYEDLVAYNNNEKALPEYVVLLSFDDGYIGNYENAFPIAKKYGIPLNIFVIDSCVGTNNYFSWDQAREMDRSGLVHIYTHGKNHIRYGEEEDIKVHEDINFALNHIEQELGHSITKVFAYPYGSYSEESIAILEKEGIVQNLLSEQYNTSNNLNLSRLTRIYSRQNYNVFRILSLIL